MPSCKMSSCQTIPTELMQNAKAATSKQSNTTGLLRSWELRQPGRTGTKKKLGARQHRTSAMIPATVQQLIFRNWYLSKLEDVCQRAPVVLSLWAALTVVVALYNTQASRHREDGSKHWNIGTLEHSNTSKCVHTDKRLFKSLSQDGTTITVSRDSYCIRYAI